jgi:hypothetical protein
VTVTIDAGGSIDRTNRDRSTLPARNSATPLLRTHRRQQRRPAQPVRRSHAASARAAAFATRIPRERMRSERFPGSREIRYPRDKVEIDRTENDDHDRTAAR